MSSAPPAAAASNNNSAAATSSTTTTTTTTTTSSKGKSSPPPAAESNLAPLLRHFAGIDVIVETKQGRSIRGRLREADAYMNLVLDNIQRRQQRQLRRQQRRRGASSSYAARSSSDEKEQQHYGDDDGDDDGDDGGAEEEFDWVHVRGPTIRYVVFGAGVDVAGVIRAGRDRERAAGDRYRRGVRKAPAK